MSQEFVPDDNLSVSEARPFGGCANEEDGPNDESAVSEQEVVQITVVGSPAAVSETIHTLYRLGFAAVGDWSPPQPTAGPGQVVSVLIRRRQLKA